jgi:hypothetical protein
MKELPCRYEVAALLIAACAAHANAQAALDRAVQALGGADALQKIEAVRLQLEGPARSWSSSWPRRMSTGSPLSHGRRSF